MCKISTGKSPLAGRETWLLEGCLAPWLKYALGRDPEVKSHLLLGARNELKLKVAGFSSLGQNDIVSLKVLRIASSQTHSLRWEFKGAASPSWSRQGKGEVASSLLWLGLSQVRGAHGLPEPILSVFQKPTAPSPKSCPFQPLFCLGLTTQLSMPPRYTFAFTSTHTQAIFKPNISPYTKPLVNFSAI